MKILVTGAAGFIGFHLVGKLIKNGLEVIGLDNINDYYDVDLKYARLQQNGIDYKNIVNDELIQSTSYSNYFFQKTDLTNLEVLKDLFDSTKFDYVIHLAAQAGVRHSLENPHAYVQSNLVGFVNVLECCRYAKVKHFIYASSSSVYGFNKKVPFSENDKVDYPVSLYAATKKSNELLAHTYSHLYQLPTTGLRFFTVYGPWGRPDMAPMIFADAIYSKKPIKVFNNGNMLRDFTYIDDIIEGMLKVIPLIPDQTNKIPYYNLFNLGNSKPVELLKFIEIMEFEIGITATLEMHPMQAGDVPVTYADTSKLNELVKYQPKTQLKEGIMNFIQWLKVYKIK